MVVGVHYHPETVIIVNHIIGFASKVAQSLLADFESLHGYCSNDSANMGASTLHR
jgi:hypothetical protein